MTTRSKTDWPVAIPFPLHPYLRRCSTQRNITIVLQPRQQLSYSQYLRNRRNLFSSFQTPRRPRLLPAYRQHVHNRRCWRHVSGSGLFNCYCGLATTGPAPSCCPLEKALKFQYCCKNPELTCAKLTTPHKALPGFMV